MSWLSPFLGPLAACTPVASAQANSSISPARSGMRWSALAPVGVGLGSTTYNQFHAESVRDGADLHPLGGAAGTAIVGLHHVDAFLQQQIHERVLVVLVLAAGNAHVEGRGQFRIAFVVVRHNRLFIY